VIELCPSRSCTTLAGKPRCAAASAIRRECIGVIETFRCELIGRNISCSRCHKKAPQAVYAPRVYSVARNLGF
jgi:hypothetical protein